MRRIPIIFVFLLVLPSLVSATEYYVDNAATGSNNGSDWANAWESFADINWGSIQPRDTIYISGGSSSKTYNETFTVGTGGTSGNPVIIQPSQDAGHNGTVIIDCENTRSVGFYLTSGKNYITIDGLQGDAINGDTDYGIKIINLAVDGGGVYSSSGVHHIKILHLDISSTQNTSTHDYQGGVIFFGSGTQYIEAGHCWIHGAGGTNPSDRWGASGIVVWSTPLGSEAYDSVLLHHNKVEYLKHDGIKTNNNACIYNNVVQYLSDPGLGSHADGLLAQSGDYVKIYNNYAQDITQGIYLDNVDTQEHQNIYLFNNVIYCPSQKALDIHVENAGWKNIHVYHNTFVESEILWDCGYYPDKWTTNLHIKNNIFGKINGNNMCPTKIPANWIFGDDDAYDYNAYSTDTKVYPKVCDWHGTKKSLAELQALSPPREVHGLIADPIYIDAAGKDFRLADNCPFDIRTGGVELASILPELAYDKNGISRTNWSKGAYEYTGQPGLCQPGDQYKIINSTHITACNCSQQSVQAAIDAASDGENVLVPAGSCTWSSTLTITKGINLLGTGIGQTVITYTYAGSGSVPAIAFSPDATSLANNKPFSVSGFTIDGGNSGTNYLLSVVNLDNTNAISKVRIHNNRFSNAGTGIAVRGAVWGVAYNNQFDDCLIPFRGMGDFRDSWDYWYDSFGYGNGNNFFFEDNIIDWTDGGSSGLYGFMEIGQGGRGVIRYNTWDMTNVGGVLVEYPYYDMIDLWDIHGNQAVGNWGGIGSEWYGNSITNDTEIRNRRLISLRGGRNLIFYNNWDFTPGAYFVLNVWDSHADSLTPINGCESLGECQECDRPQHVSDTYVWINLANGVNKLLTETSDFCNVVDENEEYFNYNASFDGINGMGCGTLSSRPATCTEGAGYWATDQSCSDLTGLVGKNPNAPISGTLYKCTATDTWSEYYQSYIYPHPLSVAPLGETICSEDEITSECWCQGMRTSGYCCHGYYGTEECTTEATYHRADNNPQDGCITMQELSAFIILWKQDSSAYPMVELMEAIRLWKQGTGCS